MKKLQNNFTTPEQSKRLLELGVPENSADCYYYKIDEAVNPNEPDIIPFGHTLPLNMRKEMYIPCWSVGRLLEILSIATKDREWMSYIEIPKSYYREDDETMIDYIVWCVKGMVDMKWSDFSKLED